ncbi:methylated-DNA--[protein]-cysteine S-methyltransferase [Herbaspirillum chlorophenolicum]|uniref:Methylated-DNA--[protein]-cysteine S-methyltransferase n=1 Tax=Herbaspirillum chlorophenolicum TaxID=211589 RepID=A0ABW8ET12_9BURK|nr:methylated-DNA--[protein]-cysteine S-methyltransferase [Herbaspirillum chlorophenolicum]
MKTSTPATQLADLFAAVVHTPFGGMGIRTEAGVVREMVYLPRHFAEKEATDPLAAKAAKQIARYLKDPEFRFKLPVADAGSEFQKRVWHAISEIPSGQVLTYGDIARRIKSAPRAVGQACGANWYPLIVPCHRVTAAGGLGGFSHHDDVDGFYLNVKRWLLKHEGVTGY